MIRKVAILANGGDVSGFNAVIRAIIKTAENNDIECYGFVEGYKGLLENNYVQMQQEMQLVFCQKEDLLLALLQIQMYLIIQ